MGDVKTHWNAKNILTAIIIGAAIGAVVVSLMGCATLDHMVGLPPEEEAAPVATPADHVVAVASKFHPGAGGLLGIGFAAYQLLRKRSRQQWVAAGKALVPHKGDASIRLGDALKNIDKALGGGHTSTQTGA